MKPSESEDRGTRAGYVVLLGYPNAGKSSLLNQLLDQKLSIVTALPQTTRERVVGIDTRDDVQMIFIDTPGLVEPRYLLHRSMLHEAMRSVTDADVALLIVDPLHPPPDVESDAVRVLRSRADTTIIVINKTDVASRDRVELAERWAADAGFAASARVSALTGDGVEELRTTIARLLPESPYFFPPDEISSQPVRFFTAELIRETVFELFRDEVPYSAAVRIEEFRESSDPIFVRATIFVERESQKGILIGSGGYAIRKIGAAARAKIEEFVGGHVYLDLRVKVLPRWRKKPESLRHLGYTVPPDA